MDYRHEITTSDGTIEIGLGEGVAFTLKRISVEPKNAISAAAGLADEAPSDGIYHIVDENRELIYIIQKTDQTYLVIEVLPIHFRMDGLQFVKSR